MCKYLITPYFSLLNEQDNETGDSPLHIAIKAKDWRCLQILMSLNVSLDVVNKNKDTPFHYAAVTNKEIIAVRFHLHHRLQFPLLSIIFSFYI